MRGVWLKHYCYGLRAAAVLCLLSQSPESFLSHVDFAFGVSCHQSVTAEYLELFESVQTELPLQTKIFKGPPGVPVCPE